MIVLVTRDVFLLLNTTRPALVWQEKSPLKKEIRMALRKYAAWHAWAFRRGCSLRCDVSPKLSTLSHCAWRIVRTHLNTVA